MLAFLTFFDKIIVRKGQRDDEMRVSDMIASWLMNMMDDENGTVEVQRSELADRFSCVPSQINYVIETRFSPEHGFLVESRRGGGGYIRIKRVSIDPQTAVMHAINAIGDEIDAKSASAVLSNLVSLGRLTERECRLLTHAVSNRALQPADKSCRDHLRANLLKTALVSILTD